MQNANAVQQGKDHLLHANMWQLSFTRWRTSACWGTTPKKMLRAQMSSRPGIAQESEKQEPQLAADIDWKRPRLGTRQANAPTTRAVADRRHPDDRGKTQARVLEIVKESAAQGRLTGMVLIVGDQSAVELVRKKQKEKRLWRTKALKKNWEKLKARQAVLDAQKSVAHDHCYFTTPVSCKFDLIGYPVLERSSERERCQDVLRRTRGAE